MKIRNVFLSTVLLIALTLPMFGRHTQEEKAKTDMKQHDMSSMMGKPTVDATVKGLRMKVWLITQKQHKKMMDGKMGQMMKGEDMKEMKHDGMEMDKATRDAMMAGTHHIMVDATDAANGKEIAAASAKVLILSPSKKNSTVDLKPIMGHFGLGLTLEEKGKYQFTVIVDDNGIPKSKRFQYTVK